MMATTTTNSTTAIITSAGNHTPSTLLLNGPPYDGLMFYSIDPASDWGYVLTPDGHTVPKKSAAR